MGSRKGRPGKRKRRKKIGSAPPHAPAQRSKQAPASDPWWKRTWLAVVAAIGLISSLAGLYLFFSSSVSVSAGELLTQDALSTPFTINNVSQFFTLKELAPDCRPVYVEYSHGLTFDHDRSSNYAPVIPELSPGGFDTVYCSVPFKIAPGDDVTVNADVIITVHYGLSSILFLRKEDSYRFITRMASDGKLRWIHYGLSDMNPDFKSKP